MDSIYCSPDLVLETQNPTTLYVLVNRMPVVCIVAARWWLRWQSLSASKRLISKYCPLYMWPKIYCVSFMQLHLWTLSSTQYTGSSILCFVWVLSRGHYTAVKGNQSAFSSTLGYSCTPSSISIGTRWMWRTYTRKGGTHCWLSHRRSLECLILSTGS